VPLHGGGGRYSVDPGVPYDSGIVGSHSNTPVTDAGVAPFVADTPQPAVTALPASRSGPRHRRTKATSAVGRGLSPAGRWLAALAYVVVAAPFAYAVLRLATAPAAHLTLPDDLALIDLHVRRALVWKQQLGVFDHNNWNHPGPAYFYLVSLVYRVLGSSARSLFVASTLLNGLSAVACVGVVHRRSGAARALWAAVVVCALAAVLAAGGASSTTYSESVLGALVSPWNPTVVLFPLLLVVLLCAGAVDRSGVSLVGAVLVGSFVVQTDIATLPLVGALIGAAGLAWVVTMAADRRGGRERAGRSDASRWWARVMAGVGVVGFALLWLPPALQQAANHPGNLTLVYRFFQSSHHGQAVSAALWSVTGAFGVVVLGPGEIMPYILGGAPPHPAVAVSVTVATVAVALTVAVTAWRLRLRFALGTAAAVLIGAVVAVVAVTHVVGFIFGYLVLWALVLPVAALIGVGQLPVPGLSARPTARTGGRMVLCAVAVCVAVIGCVRVADIPPLSHAGDPNVAELGRLVTPRLPTGVQVFVGDGGAGTKDSQLLDTEEFIGLVNLLDRAGYRPTVNHVWKAQFGPGYRTTGSEPRAVSLSTWTPASPVLPGYVGKVGDMAVTVTDSVGAAAPVG